MEKILSTPGLHHIAEMIFLRLDLESLSNCRLVSRNWKQFIDQPNMWLVNLPKDHILGSHFGSIWLTILRGIIKVLDGSLKQKIAVLVMELYHFSCETKSSELCFSYYSTRKRKRSHFYFIYPMAMAYKKGRLDLLEEIVIQIGSVEFVKIYHNPENPNKLDQIIKPPKSTLQIASLHGYTEIAKLMMKVQSLQEIGVCYNYSPKISDEWKQGTAISNAAYYGHFEIVKSILSYNIPEEEFLAPLVFAVLNGHVQMAKEILKYFSDYSILYTKSIRSKMPYKVFPSVTLFSLTAKSAIEFIIELKNEAMIDLILSKCDPPRPLLPSLIKKAVAYKMANYVTRFCNNDLTQMEFKDIIDYANRLAPSCEVSVILKFLEEEKRKRSSTIGAFINIKRFM